MATLPAMAFATSTLTSTGTFTDTQTVTIGGKVYTAQTTLTDVDGNFLIGADQTASHLNLLRAINLGAGAGTLYATSTTIHPLVTATSSDGTHTIIKAKVAGAQGNLITTTETLTNASWTSTVMASGSGVLYAALDAMRDESQMNAALLQQLNNLLHPTLS